MKLSKFTKFFLGLTVAALVGIASILMFIGDEDPIDYILPDSLLVGAIPKIDINGRIKDSNRIDAEVVVPHDISRKQIKPTLLAAIKGIRNDHPKYAWINVFLYAGGGLKDGGVSPGRAEYKDHRITIYYGIPSARQIEIKREVAAEYPDSNPRSIPVLISKEEFTKALKIYNLYYRKHNQLRDQYNALYMDKKISRKKFDELGDDIIDAAMRLVGEEAGITPAKVLEYREKIGFYYGWSWDQETIELKKYSNQSS